MKQLRACGPNLKSIPVNKIKFSVVVASYLGDYPNAAIHREQKFNRAIDSILNQTFKNFEIVIVADGCARTKALYQKYYAGNSKIKLVEIEKQPLFSSGVRNAGIEHAAGDYITYLDTDDKLGQQHLQVIADNLSGYDWVWYDDYLMNREYRPQLNPCFLKYGKCGTSNITHKRILPARWKHAGYSFDDWGFIQELMKLPDYAKIKIPEYIICHQPRRVDV